MRRSCCWRSLYLSLINCEIELSLSYSKDCIISETSRTPEMAEDNLLQAILPTGATFEMNNAKRYVS